MFLTTGEGVIVIDAPQPLGEKYLEAVAEVTDEPNNPHDILSLSSRPYRFGRDDFSRRY